MTPSERRVARTLLATYPTAGLESLPQLAEGAGVTGPTVLRFVRKIGFEGYPDFQRSLREEVQARTEGLPSLYRTKGGTHDDEVVARSQQAFTRALDTLELTRRDVLCVFDYRRYQPDTVAAGRLAAEQGAVVVAFTDPWLSP